MKPNNHYDVFLSYRRLGGIDTARTFYDRLTAIGYRVSFDIETLRNGKFNEQLYRRIDECKDVIVVLNRTALDLREDPDDDWLRLEVAYAIKKGKNVIPVFLRDYEPPKAGTLPPDIADLVKFQGVMASDEHFDSTLSRICGLMESKPHRPWMGKFLAAAVVLSLLGTGMTCWFCRDAVFPYPLLQRDRQRVGNLVGYVALLATTYDELIGGELELVEKARLGIVVDSRYEYDFAVDLFKKKIVGLQKQFDNLNLNLPKVLSDIETMPVDSAGFPMFIEGVRQDFSLVDDFLQTLGHAADPKDVMQKTERLQLIELKKKSIECQGRIFACDIMGMFSNISEQSLADIKKIALQWEHLPDLARTWLRDEKEIERVGESLCNQYENVLTELATITGNANVGLAEEREKLKRIGVPSEQIEDMMSKIEKLEEKKGQLADARKDIEDAKALVRVKFAPKSTDDVGTLWGKALKFLSLDMKDEALNVVLELRKRESGEFPPEACAAAEAFICSRGRLPFVSGVMVTGIEPPAKEHAIFKIGDIVIEQDGKAIYGFDDYRAKEGSVYLVCRYNGNGNFDMMPLKMPSRQPRVALVDISEAK